ncbi:MAG: hypothetical protein Q9228_006974 [Teloschistes exilis]
MVSDSIVKEKHDVENTLKKARDSLREKDEQYRKDGERITQLTKDKEATEGERDDLKVKFEKAKNERQEAASAKDDAETRQASMESELQRTKELWVQKDGHVQEYDKLLQAADQTITNSQSQVLAPDQQTHSQEAVDRLIRDATQKVWKHVHDNEISPRDKHIDRLGTVIEAAVGNLRLQAQFETWEDLDTATSQLWKKIMRVEAGHTAMQSNMEQLSCLYLCKRERSTSPRLSKSSGLQEERTRHESSPGASPDTNYKGLHTLYRKLLAERDWYKSRNTDLNNQKAKLEQEKETLARERGTSRTLNSNYQSQIQNLKTEIADLGSQKQRLQGNCDELKRDAEGLSKEKTELESRRNELSSEVKDLQAQKGRLWKTFKANTYSTEEVFGIDECH